MIAKTVGESVSLMSLTDGPPKKWTETSGTERRDENFKGVIGKQAAFPFSKAETAS